MRLTRGEPEGPSPQADGQPFIPKERGRGPAHRGPGARVLPAHVLQQVCLHLVLLATSQRQLEKGARGILPSTGPSLSYSTTELGSILVSGVPRGQDRAKSRVHVAPGLIRDDSQLKATGLPRPISAPRRRQQDPIAHTRASAQGSPVCFKGRVFLSIASEP